MLSPADHEAHKMLGCCDLVERNGLCQRGLANGYAASGCVAIYG